MYHSDLFNPYMYCVNPVQRIPQFPMSCPNRFDHETFVLPSSCLSSPVNILRVTMVSPPKSHWVQTAPILGLFPSPIIYEVLNNLHPNKIPVKVCLYNSFCEIIRGALCALVTHQVVGDSLYEAGIHSNSSSYDKLVNFMQIYDQLCMPSSNIADLHRDCVSYIRHELIQLV